MKNTYRILAMLLALTMLVGLTACGTSGQSANAPKDDVSGQNADVAAQDGALKDITICLDWTPNTNHTGLYVALANGYYKDAGLNVSIVQPPEDGATAICAAGQVEFAVTVQDSLASAFAREDPLNITAVAAMLQHNTSGIISRAGEGLGRPAGLAGHTYSTWDSPIELAMMEEVVTADGASFDDVNLIPNNIYDEAGALRENQTDSIWVYYGWGCIAAELQGLDFDYFYFKDITPAFDYYTPVIIANNDFLTNDPETAKAFLAATSKGYEFAIEHPDEAAQILIDGDETGSLAGSEELVKKSQQYMVDQYQAEAPKWGYIDPARWNAFYNWLNDKGLVEVPIPENTGFSNDYLP